MPEPHGLARELAGRIAEHGPISIAAWIGAANAAYYGSRDPLGEAGDFITAPEISQMFGELIGLWAADLLARADMRHAHYVELGPGRGTLAADAMRAAGRHGWQPAMHFVERSPVFAARLAERFADAQVHADIDTLPGDVPLIVVANEFFDALPIHQYERTGQGWRERHVGHDDSRGFFVTHGDANADAFVPPEFRDAPVGSIREANHAAAALIAALGPRIARQGGAILAIDYGHGESALGDTLQAVRGHRFADAFARPGEHDLTAHVDFAALSAAGRAAGLSVAGPTTQGAFLGGLGLAQRGQALAGANREKASDVMAAVDRLASPREMGELFKVIALYCPAWPDPAGF